MVTSIITHDAPETWLTQLRESGQRLTPARRAVVETLVASERAITPLEVYDAARRRYRRLGLVSVYRALETLEALGLIRRVHQPEGCQAFIAAGDGHQHLLVCRNCGRVALFEGDDLDRLIASISRKSGYQIQEHWLQLFGVCGNCRRRTGRKNEP
jgi:Fur family ferric uptake transcriptional regulator